MVLVCHDILFQIPVSSIYRDIIQTTIDIFRLLKPMFAVFTESVNSTNENVELLRYQCQAGMTDLCTKWQQVSAKQSYPALERFVWKTQVAHPDNRQWPVPKWWIALSRNDITIWIALQYCIQCHTILKLYYKTTLWVLYENKNIFSKVAWRILPIIVLCRLSRLLCIWLYSGVSLNSIIFYAWRDLLLLWYGPVSLSKIANTARLDI